MGCFKTLTLSGGCELETCVTASKVTIGTDVVSTNQDGGLSFAEDLCYCAVLSHNAASTELYISKYEGDSNTLVKKATFAYASASGNMVYDASRQRFVFCAGTFVNVFNPLDNSVVTFDSGIASLFNMVYVPQHSRIYGEFGVNGGGQTYIGYIDLDLNIIVQLGIIPAFGPSNPRPYNLVYVPSTNCLYGSWATGLSAGLAKFNLNTNTGFALVGGTFAGIDICLDTDTNRLIGLTNGASEWSPDTETMIYSGATTEAIGWTLFYSSALKKVIGAYWDSSVDGGPSVISYNTQTKITTVEFNAYPEGFQNVRELKDGSIITRNRNMVTNVSGVRRLCIT